MTTSVTQGWGKFIMLASNGGVENMAASRSNYASENAGIFSKFCSKTFSLQEQVKQSLHQLNEKSTETDSLRRRKRIVF